MTPPPEGTPWWAWIAGTIVLALIGLGVVWVGQRRTGRQLDRAGVQLDHVVDQVKNSHDVPLRDDLDHKNDETQSKLNIVLSELAAARADIGGLRSELRTERRERIGLADRVVDLERHRRNATPS